MASNNQELSKRVETEYDKLLKVDNSGQHNLGMDTLVKESMPQAAGGTQSVVIQMQTDTMIESHVVPSSFPRIRFPVAITTISLLQILLFVYDSMNRQNGNFDQSAVVLLFASNYKMEIWRYITYMFVHQEFHLGLNIFFQLLGGVPLEITHGWWRITIVYLVGVLGGSLGVQALSSCNALVGGSAGVYSILGAHFSTLILNWKETEDRLIRIFILLVYVLTDIFNWMCIPKIMNHPEFGSSTCILVSELTNSTISHACGCIAGILMAVVIFKNFYVRSWERKTQVISFLILLFLILLAISLIIFLPNFNIRSLTLNCNKSLNRVVVKDAVVKCKQLV